MGQIDRRTLLAAVVGGLLSACTTATVAKKGSSRGPLVADDVRLRGLNLIPDLSEMDTCDQGSVWSATWRAWNWDGRYKPQIDDASEIANGIRILGNTHVVTSGNITLGQYLDRWQQLLDYATQKNLMVYPCGGDLSHWGRDSSWSAVSDIYANWSKLLAEYRNVIGVDITNEAWTEVKSASGPMRYSQKEPFEAVLTHLGDVVRQTADLPVAHSFTIWDSSAWNISDKADEPLKLLFGASDFIDLHLYDTPTRERITAIMRSQWAEGKGLVLGEFGIDGSAPELKQTEMYQDVSTVVAADRAISGALAWGCWDLSSEPKYQFGVYDANRELRPYKSTAFSNLPVDR